MKRAAIATERSEQRALIQWWQSYAPTVGLDVRLLLAIPQGTIFAGDAKRRAMQAHSLKLEGLRPGAPDLLLLVPRGQYHAMALEMKRSDWKKISGKHEETQASYLQCLHFQLYYATFAAGADSAMSIIKKYLGQQL